MKITASILKEKEACVEGIAWFTLHFPDGGELQAVYDAVGAHKHTWQSWLAEVFKMSCAVSAWHTNGQLGYHENYHAGKREGVREWWDANGQLEYRENYHAGELEGVSERWHTNGQLEYSENYQAGKLEGVSECWYFDGTLRRREYYRAGKREK